MEKSPALMPGFFIAAKAGRSVGANSLLDKEKGSKKCPGTAIITLGLQRRWPLFEGKQVGGTCGGYPAVSAKASWVVLPFWPERGWAAWPPASPRAGPFPRSEEHTSELQSRGHLVCRLLLEKKKKKKTKTRCKKKNKMKRRIRLYRNRQEA